MRSPSHINTDTLRQSPSTLPPIHQTYRLRSHSPLFPQLHSRQENTPSNRLWALSTFEGTSIIFRLRITTSRFLPPPLPSDHTRSTPANRFGLPRDSLLLVLVWIPVEDIVIIMSYYYLSSDDGHDEHCYYTSSDDEDDVYWYYVPATESAQTTTFNYPNHSHNNYYAPPHPPQHHYQPLPHPQPPATPISHYYPPGTTGYMAMNPASIINPLYSTHSLHPHHTVAYDHSPHPYYDHRHPQIQKPQPRHRPSSGSDYAAPQVRPHKNFAENQPGFQNAMGPFPQPSMVPKVSKAPKKGEFGSVLGAQA